MAVAGEQVDETGLVYLRARYYDPQIGRFICKDFSGPEAPAIAAGERHDQEGRQRGRRQCPARERPAWPAESARRPLDVLKFAHHGLNRMRGNRHRGRQIAHQLALHFQLMRAGRAATGMGPQFGGTVFRGFPVDET